ncbi:MAG: c-type cytochrome [Dehalococcoidia bacterium]
MERGNQRIAQGALPIVALAAFLACGSPAPATPISTSVNVPSPVQTSTKAPPPVETLTATPTIVLLSESPTLPAELPFPVGDPATGSGIFAGTCAVCHGEAGNGEPGLAPGLTEDWHAWHHPDRQIREWIAEGKPGLGANMPPYGDRLDEQNISDVIAYVKSLWTPEQREVQLDVSLRYEEGYRKYGGQK